MLFRSNELGSIVIRDQETVHELKNFVRMPNGTWRARDGQDLWDDRVMSLIWALMILEQSLTERYFEIVKYDDNGKPLIIKSLYEDFKQYMNPLPMYDGVSADGGALPMSFGDTDTPDDINELIATGWMFPDDKY